MGAIAENMRWLLPHTAKHLSNGLWSKSSWKTFILPPQRSISVTLTGTPAGQTLSGGNQQKVVLAKWLLQHPLILILDEPTRGIDVGAKYEIYSIMNQHTASGGGVLFISSEIEELIGICDRILVMRKGEIQQTFDRTTFDREKILQAALGES